MKARRLAALAACCALLTGCVTGSGDSSSGGSGRGAEGGGDFLSRVKRISCANPLVDTYECFAGTFASVVADPDSASAPEGGGELAALDGEDADDVEQGAVVATAEPRTAAKPFQDRPPRTRSFDGGLGAGEGEALPINGAGKVIRSPALKSYAESVLAKVLAHAPMEPPPMAVFITAETGWGGFATIENDIFINLGSFKEARSESEIAALLAHEASHIMLRHFNREQFFEQQQELTSSAVDAAILVSSLAAAGKNFNQGQAGQAATQASIENNKRKALIAGEVADFVANDVINASMTRRQEDEADLLGTDMMLAAGYGRRGATRVFQILQKVQGEKELAIEKLELNSTELETSMQQDGFSASALVGFVTSSVGRVGTALWSDVRGWTRRTHLDPESRLESIKGYMRREYRGKKSKLVVGDFKRAKRSAKFKSLYDRYTAVETAFGFFTDDKFEEALVPLRQGMRGSVAKDPYPVSLKARILDGLGRQQEALRTYGTVRPGSIFSITGYSHKASLELAANNPQAALRTSDLAASNYGVDMFRHLRIQAYGQLGDAAQVQAEAAACDESELRSARDQCDAALAGIPKALGGTQGDDEGGIGSALGGLSDSLGGLFQ